MRMEQINGKWLAVESWGIEDVLYHDNGENDLTENECVEVLKWCCEYHDCNEGMSWDIMNCAIDRVVGEREETAA
mgnify:CR=1 FL=1